MIETARRQGLFFKPDVSIITFDGPFFLTYKINPICLPITREGITKHLVTFYNKKYSFAGWGESGSEFEGKEIKHGADRTTLWQASLYQVPYVKCYEVWEEAQAFFQRSELHNFYVFRIYLSDLKFFFN